ncbi:MAG TPA: hypothetical protein VMV62_00360 [Candidatus Paceibacterota bacterium]|nr:hypothetical protein [Candidatus Paceibacterota bacterium]
MTRKSVEDDKYGRLWRRLDELARRVDEGTLDPYRVMEILRHTIEGKMPELLSAGGLVLTELQSVTIEVGPSIREGLNKLDASFPCRNPGKTKLKVGVLRYVRFSREDEAPGTKRILRDMQDNGVRAGTASELLAIAESSASLVSSWGEYIAAFGSATNKGGIFTYMPNRYNRDRFGEVELAGSGRSAPWWPSCYSFFVAKDA